MSGISGTGAVLFRGWRERDPRWWGNALGSVVCAAFGAAVVFKAGRSGEDPAGLVFGVMCVAAGAAGVGLMVRHRVVVDADGVTVRWVRSNTRPWTAVAALVVLRTERDRLDVLVVDADGAGKVLCRPRDPLRFVEDATAQRPPDVTVPPLPDTPVADPARSLVVVASALPWSVFTGFAACASAVMLALFVSLGTWWLAMMAALYAVTLFGMAVAFYPLTRRALSADCSGVRVRTRRRLGTYPMSAIRKFIIVYVPGQQKPDGIAALIDGQAVRLPVPKGKGQHDIADLVLRLERLRLASVEQPENHQPVASDPKYKAPRIPGAPIKSLVPVLFFVASSAMLLAVPFGMVADRRAADIVRARSIPTTGTVTAINTSSNDHTALVRYDTTNGPVTVEFTVERDEETGTRPLDLLYDTQQPSRVWRNGAIPPDTVGWANTVIFLFWVPLALGLTLWLRWHPPSLTDPDPDTPSLVAPLGLPS